MKNDMDERTEAPPEENKKRRLGGKAIAAIVCGALAAFFGLVTLILRDPFTLILTVIMLIPVIVLVIMIAHEKYKERHPEYSFLPYWGIIAEAMCVPLFLLGIEISFSPLFSFIMLLTSIFCPVFGIVAGSVALTQERKNCSTGGFVVAIIDIIIPPLAVIVIILLFSLDVIVISLM